MEPASNRRERGRLNAVGFDVTRPINDWCADGTHSPDPGSAKTAPTRFGPQWAESWDDWGLYTPMYAQHVGLDGSTVEMCSRRTATAESRATTHHQRPAWARRIQYITTTSTLEYVVDNRNEMLYDEAERYRRGVAGDRASTATRRSTSTTTG